MLADEVLLEVDGSRLEGVCVLLHLLPDDLEQGAIVYGAVDLPQSVRTAGEPRIDGEQIPALLARDDAEPVLRANLRDEEEWVVPRKPFPGVWLVVLDRERVGELRLGASTDPIESVHQRPSLRVFVDFFSELCHVVLLKGTV